MFLYKAFIEQKTWWVFFKMTDVLLVCMCVFKIQWQSSLSSSKQASKQAKLKKTKKTEWVFIKRQPKTKYALMVL